MNICLIASEPSNSAIFLDARRIILTCSYLSIHLRKLRVKLNANAHANRDIIFCFLVMFCVYQSYFLSFAVITLLMGIPYILINVIS